jgi:hypothetical protein
VLCRCVTAAEEQLTLDIWEYQEARLSPNSFRVLFQDASYRSLHWEYTFFHLALRTTPFSSFLCRR